MIFGNDAVAQWIVLTGQHAIAQGNALGREILRNSSPEGAQFDRLPPEESRPFRAKSFLPPMTQGDALGYRMLPRWDNSTRRFLQNMKRGSILNVKRNRPAHPHLRHQYPDRRKTPQMISPLLLFLFTSMFSVRCSMFP